MEPLPETLIPPHQVPPEQKDAYWTELLNDTEKLRQAAALREFFPFVQDLPASVWEKRAMIYLYRFDDDGLNIRNAEGAKKLIPPRITFPINEDWVAQTHGGGSFKLMLNFDGDVCVKEARLRIAGPPKVQDGQTVITPSGQSIHIGKDTAQTPAQARAETDVARVIDASAEANKSSMEIMANASKAAIEMVRDQVKPTGTSSGTESLELALRIVEVMKPAAAPVAQDPVAAALTLMDRLESIVAKRNPEPEPPPETSLEAINTAVETITGKSIAELGRGAKPSAGEPEYGWVAPLANFGIQALAQLPMILRQMAEAREAEFQRALYLRSLQPGQPATAPPPGTSTALVPGPRPVPAQQPAAPPNPAAPPDKGTLIQIIVARVCDGFDRGRDTGADIAAAISVQFGELIEAYGMEKALYDPGSMTAELVPFPALAAALAQRTTHAKWGGFQESYFEYMMDRWGEPENEPGKEAAQAPPAA